MKTIKRVFLIMYSAVSFLFFCCALFLIIFTLFELANALGVNGNLPVRARFNSVLESIGLLTIAVASLELGQTVIEEEILRDTQLNAPTRIRRFLSRFTIVVVVALSIETMVAVFRLVHENPQHLPAASTIGFAAAALLIGWGLFVKFNKVAEETEPEAMKLVKKEDQEIEKKTH